MGSEQRIIDTILADAQAEANEIVEKAEQEAQAILKTAQDKADREAAAYGKLAEAEAEKAAAKEISSAEMEAKKRILVQKQELIEEVISAVKEKLKKLSGQEYEDTLLNMLSQSGNTADTEILLSPEDKKTYGDVFKQKGYQVSEETRDISGGFVLKKGDIEYNYSFEAMIAVEKEEIELTAAHILFN